jgi:hypothetical protein
MKSNDHAGGNGTKNWRGNSEAFAEVVERAAKRAVKAAIAEHHRAGEPVVIWEEGRIVYLYPDGSKRPRPEAPAEEAAP